MSLRAHEIHESRGQWSLLIQSQGSSWIQMSSLKEIKIETRVCLQEQILFFLHHQERACCRHLPTSSRLRTSSRQVLVDHGALRFTTGCELLNRCCTLYIHTFHSHLQPSCLSSYVSPAERSQSLSTVWKDSFLLLCRVRRIRRDRRSFNIQSPACCPTGTDVF